MKINMNDRVRVTLTAAGASIWNGQAWLATYPGKKPEPKKAGDILEDQLWSLMEIFGPNIYMGMLEVPFEGNNIELLFETTCFPNLLKRQAG